MSDSTRRTLRTLYQNLVAAAIAIPVIAAIVLPALTGLIPDADLVAKIAAGAATLVAVAVAVTKVVNSLEDAGYIPAWLKDDSLANDKTIPGQVVVDDSEDGAGDTDTDDVIGEH